MLRGIRTASSNWLGKVVMAAVVGFLVISFAIWGIGDIFRGFRATSLARVGSAEIGIEQFRQLYSERLQMLSRQIGRPITPAQARGLGLDRQLLGQVIADVALDERARQLRLGLSDAEVAKRITEDPSFRNLFGQFDRRRFELLIRNAGYTEARYVAEQRRQTLRRQIAEAVGGELSLPKVMAEAFNRYENEQRTIEYAVLDRSKAGDIPPPTADVLDKYFQERKALFRAPDFRKVVLLALTPADAARWITVSDEDARRTYEDRRDRYIVPERRQLQQITFPNAADARAASERLTKGEVTFEALAAERGLKANEIDIGMLTKAAIADKAVAEAAFLLKQGEISQPVEGTFGTAIVRVIKIEPESARNFEEVAAEIKRDIALERAKADIQKTHDKIEDDRAGGQQLGEIAPKYGLNARTIDAIDRTGRDPDGNPVPDLPPGVDILGPLFAANVGADTEPVQIPGGGYVWIEVVAVTPSRERSLDEVKARVEARWRDEQAAERLKAKAAEIVDKLKGGAVLADLATAEGLKVETAAGLRRGRATPGISSAVLAAAFQTGKDVPASAAGQTALEQVVFRVTGITVPNLDLTTEDGKRLEQVLRRSYADDLLAQYIARVESELGVTINDAALRQLTGIIEPTE